MQCVKKHATKLIFALVLGIILLHLTLGRIPEEAKVHFLDIGQGDSILVVSSELHTVLIDGGPGEKVLEELGDILPFFVRRIDMIVLTHPHSDHLEGLIEVLKRYDVGSALLAGDKYGSNLYQEFLRTINEKAKKGELQIHFASEDSDFQIPLKDSSILNFDTLYPIHSFAGREIENVNNASIVIKMALNNSGIDSDISDDFKNKNGLFERQNEPKSLPGQTFFPKSFLLTGDCEIECEEEILHHYDRQILKADILKIGHHGSRTATSQKFLDAVSPIKAIIQVGKDNKFEHPHTEILERLKKANIETKRNDLDGRVTLSIKSKES